MIRRQWLLFVAYAASAGAAVALTRFEGGVAFLWASTAILTAALIRTPMGRWRQPLVTCALASALMTGTLGLGWAAAGPLAAINVGEAAIAASLFRRWADPKEPMQSLGWFFKFVATMGVVAPLLAAIAATLLSVALGKGGVETLLYYFAGHSLGNLTFTPLALLVTGRRARRDTWAALRRRRDDVLFSLTLVAVVSVTVFSQSTAPLLFLPILAIILVTFRTGREGAAIAIVLLAITGGIATVLGHGPTQILHASLGQRLQFFQFYLAATVLTVLPVSADLQKRSHILRQLRLSEERFRLLAEHSTDILMHLNAEGEILYASPSIRNLSGHEPEDLVGSHGLKFIAPDDHPTVSDAHKRVLAGDVATFRYRGVLASGEHRWFEALSRVMYDEHGEIEGVLTVSRDITAQLAREEQLTAAALTDVLTGLPNRRAFRSMMARRRNAAAPVRDCIALLDIDHFKQINDSFGHGAGDDVLREFAAVARKALRQNDVLARIGGEEFAVFLPDTSIEQALAICDRVRSEVAATQLADAGGPVFATVSGGVAPLGQAGLDHALKAADEALYRAKQAGRDQLALAA